MKYVQYIEKGVEYYIPAVDISGFNFWRYCLSEKQERQLEKENDCHIDFDRCYEEGAKRLENRLKVVAAEFAKTIFDGEAEVYFENNHICINGIMFLYADEHAPEREENLAIVYETCIKAWLKNAYSPEEIMHDIDNIIYEDCERGLPDGRV